jgi:hypothetical protein
MENNTPAMKLTDLFLAELEREAVPTRRVLERVPEGRNDWRPHAKSMPLGYLAALVATMPAWIAMMINRDELDIAAPAGAEFKPRQVATRRGWMPMTPRSPERGKRSNPRRTST